MTRYKYNKYTIYGTHSVIEAIKSDVHVNKIFIKKANNNFRIQELIKLAKKKNSHLSCFYKYF